MGSAALGVLVGAGFLLGRRAAAPRRADWPRLLVVGLLWFPVYNVALNAAEQRLDAGTAAMLVNVAPVLRALLAGVGLGEGFPLGAVGRSA